MLSIIKPIPSLSVRVLPAAASHTKQTATTKLKTCSEMRIFLQIKMLTMLKMNVVLYLYVRLLLSCGRNILMFIIIEIPVFLSFVNYYRLIRRIFCINYPNIFMKLSCCENHYCNDLLFVLFNYNDVNKTIIT